MIKVLKRNKWDMEFAKAIIDSYNEVSKLRRDVNIMYYMLIYSFHKDIGG